MEIEELASNESTIRVCYKDVWWVYLHRSQKRTKFRCCICCGGMRDGAALTPIIAGAVVKIDSCKVTDHGLQPCMSCDRDSTAREEDNDWSSGGAGWARSRQEQFVGTNRDKIGLGGCLPQISSSLNHCYFLLRLSESIVIDLWKPALEHSSNSGLMCDH